MDLSREAEADHAAERARAASRMVLLTLASAQFLMTLDSAVPAGQRATDASLRARLTATLQRNQELADGG